MRWMDGLAEMGQKEENGLGMPSLGKKWDLVALMLSRDYAARRPRSVRSEIANDWPHFV
jgi:hypothetical protein